MIKGYFIVAYLAILTCKCPSDKGHLLCGDTFAVVRRCLLIRGFTVNKYQKFYLKILCENLNPVNTECLHLESKEQNI